MSQSEPIPIILCGKTEKIGAAVIDALKPEIEVVQFVLSGDSGLTIIPAVLSGQPPPPHREASSLGTRNYSRTPQAVVFGGAFGHAAISTLRDASMAVEGARKVAWLGQDHSIDAPPVTSPEYITAVVERCKASLQQVRDGGKLDGVFDDVALY